MASTASRNCRYAQSHATARPIRDELAANAGACASFYLDTVEGMSNDFLSTEGEDHHQGLARSHRLAPDEQHPSDVEFLPDVEDVDAGYLLVIEEVVEKRVAVYRWSPSEGLVLHDHVFQGFPGVIPDQALRKANGEVFDTRYGPDFVFIDRVGACYYLGIASGHWGWGSSCGRRPPTCSPSASPV